jgi:hypothetical protein
MRIALAIGLLVGSLLVFAKPVYRALPYFYPYARPAVTVDAVVVSLPGEGQDHGSVLLIRRKNPPFKGYYALPGKHPTPTMPTRPVLRPERRSTPCSCKDLTCRRLC